MLAYGQGTVRRRETVEPEGGSLKPWLLGIATHKAHNAHSANRALRRRLAFLARSPEPALCVSAGLDYRGRRRASRRSRPSST